MKRKITFLIAALFALALIIQPTRSWGQTSSTMTFDFEDNTAHRTSGQNNYSTGNTYTENSVTISLTYADAVTTGSPLTGSANVLGRIAKKTTNSPVILIGPITTSEWETITKIEYNVKGVTAMSQVLATSPDNSNWTDRLSIASLPTTTTKKETNNNLSITAGDYFYLRITTSVSSADQSNNRDFQVDDIVITYTTSGGSSTPSINANDVNIAYNTTSGSIAYSIDNGSGSVTANVTTGGDWLTKGTITESAVGFTCSANTNTASNRTATVTLSYTGADDKVVTVTQAAAPVLYTVTFNTNGGSFSGNEAFPNTTNSKEAGSYTLPTATKDGWNFAGWKKDETETIYQAGASYTVNSNVAFTAQWSHTLKATYTIATASSVNVSGAPQGSSATFANTYTSNKNQLTSGKTMTLTLSGYAGQRIVGVSLSMKSNQSSGAGYLSITGGSTTLKTIGASNNGVNFSDSQWYGSWSTSYVDVDVLKYATYAIQNNETLVIVIGATVNSLFCESFTIEYQDADLPAISADDNVVLACNATSGVFNCEVINPVVNTDLETSSDVDWISDISYNSNTNKINFTTTANVANKRQGTVTLTYGDITRPVKIVQNAPTFTVEYDANGGSGTMTDPQSPYEYGSTVTTLTNTFTNDDVTLTFGGWNTAADGTGDDYQPGETFTITKNTTLYAQWRTSHVYAPVANSSALVAGKHYIFVSNKGEQYYAMGKQKSNNRDAVPVTIENDGKINEVTGIYEFVISGDNTNNWTIYDKKNLGYLYTANNSNSRLLNQTNNDNNGVWTVSFSGSNVTFTSTGHNSNNIIMFNNDNTNTLFSCYSSTATTYGAISLYVREDETDSYEYYSPTNISTNTTLAADNTITVESGAKLTFSGSLTCTNASWLVIEDGAQLIYSTSVAATVKKKITAPTPAAEKDGDVYGWYTISSPVHTGSYAYVTIGNETTVNLTADDYDMFAYDEATQKWINRKSGGNASGFNEMYKGQGYIYRNSGNELSFVGNTNVDAIDCPLTKASTGDLAGFNLIGNPYTHSITKGKGKAIDTDDASFTTGFFVLEDNAWVTYKDGDEIKANQGVLVKVTDAAATFQIKDVNYVAPAKSNGDNIKFIVSNGQFKDVAYALFDKGIGLDKINHRSPDVPMLYINQGGQDYAIATMSDDTKAFNLNFKAGKMGKYTLGFDANNHFNYLHLIDLLTGEDVDMLLEKEYSFIATPSDKDNRFIVKLGYNPNNEPSSDDIFAYQSGSEIYVTGNGELQIFDVTGRQVMNTTINGMESINIPNQGVYIFRLNEKVQKIVVR